MMNERIRKLIRNLDNELGRYYWTDEEKEKFAELIVRECARIVPNTDLGDVEGGDSAVLREASKQIRQHFGVES
jgi:hypothetical protein